MEGRGECEASEKEEYHGVREVAKCVFNVEYSRKHGKYGDEECGYGYRQRLCKPQHRYEYKNRQAFQYAFIDGQEKINGERNYSAYQDDKIFIHRRIGVKCG